MLVIFHTVASKRFADLTNPVASRVSTTALPIERLVIYFAPCGIGRREICRYGINIIYFAHELTMKHVHASGEYSIAVGMMVQSFEA